MEAIRIDMYREEFYNNYKTRFDEPSREITLSDYSSYISHLRKTYTQYLPKDKSSKILELGAGYGFFLYALKQEGYNNVLGIEISRESIDVAKNLGIDNIHSADIKSFLTDKDNLYDVIIAIDVFEHFYKDEVLIILKSVYKTLRDDGIVILQVPNGYYPFGGIYQYGDFTHETAFSPNSMRQVLRTVGFDDVLLKSCDTYKTKPFYKYLFWKMLRRAIKFYISFETYQRMDILTPNFVAIGKKMG